MNQEPELIQRVRTVLADLRKLVDERVAAERQMQGNFKARTETIERDYTAGRQRVDSHEDQEAARLKKEYGTARTQATARYEAEKGPLEAEYQALQEEIAKRYETDATAAKAEWEDAEWMGVSLWEGHQKGAVGGFEQWQRDVQALFDRLTRLVGRVWRSPGAVSAGRFAQLGGLHARGRA